MEHLSELIRYEPRGPRKSSTPFGSNEFASRVYTALFGPTVFFRSRRGSGWSPVVFGLFFAWGLYSALKWCKETPRFPIFGTSWTSWKKLQRGIHENNWDTLPGSNISYPLPRHFWVDQFPVMWDMDYFPYPGIMWGSSWDTSGIRKDTLSFQQSTAGNAFIQDRKGPR